MKIFAPTNYDLVRKWQTSIDYITRSPLFMSSCKFDKSNSSYEMFVFYCKEVYWNVLLFIEDVLSHQSGRRAIICSRIENNFVTIFYSAWKSWFVVKNRVGMRGDRSGGTKGREIEWVKLSCVIAAAAKRGSISDRPSSQLKT